MVSASTTILKLTCQDFILEYLNEKGILVDNINICGVNQQNKTIDLIELNLNHLSIEKQNVTHHIAKALDTFEYDTGYLINGRKISF